MKILLLEDDDLIAQQIKSYFELSDASVDIYSNGLELLESCNPKAYDIMLLDINTPGISGLEVLKSFRELSIDTPAIFVTAMGDLEYLKEAYSIGCNDFVRKPFDLEELELRVLQLTHKDKIFNITKSYSFNLKEQKLFRDSIEVPLNKNEQRFLYLLVKFRGSSVAKEQIIDYIWDSQEVCNNTVRTMVKKLRAKLKEDFIISIRGVGYKLSTYP